MDVRKFYGDALDKKDLRQSFRVGATDAHATHREEWEGDGQGVLEAHSEKGEGHRERQGRAQCDVTLVTVEV